MKCCGLHAFHGVVIVETDKQQSGSTVVEGRQNPANSFQRGIPTAFHLTFVGSGCWEVLRIRECVKLVHLTLTCLPPAPPSTGAPRGTKTPWKQQVTESKELKEGKACVGPIVPRGRQSL